MYVNRCLTYLNVRYMTYKISRKNKVITSKLSNGDKFKIDLGSSWANKALEIQIEPIHGGFTIGNQQPYPSYYSSTNTAGSTYRIQDVKNTGIVVKLPNDWNPLVKTQTSGVFFSDNFPKNFYYSIIAKMSEMDNNYPVGDSSRIVLL